MHDYRVTNPRIQQFLLLSGTPELVALAANMYTNLYSIQKPSAVVLSSGSSSCKSDFDVMDEPGSVVSMFPTEGVNQKH